MLILLFFVGHWYSSLFTQTFFLHRYSAHKMFTMNKFWERVFYIFTFISQGSSYLSPRAYGLLHRLHHAHADTELDPHSPKYSKNIFSLMFKTKRIYLDILKGKHDIEERFKRNLPQWDAFEKFADNWGVRIAWGIFYILMYYFIAGATYWYLWFLLPIHFLMGPTHGAIINWFAHKIGYRNHKVKDTSTNLMNWDLLMFGEGLHNNHHGDPYRVNFAKRWFEFDPAYPVIKLLSWLRIIKIKKKVAVPAEVKRS